MNAVKLKSLFSHFFLILIVLLGVSGTYSAERDPAAAQSSAEIEVYTGTGSIFSKYYLSMQKNLWGLKAEYQSKSAETKMTADAAFQVQSRLFDLSMRDPKKNQKCKVVAKIKTSIGDSLLCEEDARSMGKFKVLIGEMNKVLANRGKKLKNTH